MSTAFLITGSTGFLLSNTLAHLYLTAKEAGKADDFEYVLGIRQSAWGDTNHRKKLQREYARETKFFYENKLREIFQLSPEQEYTPGQLRTTKLWIALEKTGLKTEDIEAIIDKSIITEYDINKPETATNLQDALKEVRSEKIITMHGASNLKMYRFGSQERYETSLRQNTEATHTLFSTLDDPRIIKHIYVGTEYATTKNASNIYQDTKQRAENAFTEIAQSNRENAIQYVVVNPATVVDGISNTGPEQFYELMTSGNRLGKILEARLRVEAMRHGQINKCTEIGHKGVHIDVVSLKETLTGMDAVLRTNLTPNPETNVSTLHIVAPEKRSVLAREVFREIMKAKGVTTTSKGAQEVTTALKKENPLIEIITEEGALNHDAAKGWTHFVQRIKDEQLPGDYILGDPRDHITPESIITAKKGFTIAAKEGGALKGDIYKLSAELSAELSKEGDERLIEVRSNTAVSLTEDDLSPQHFTRLSIEG